MLSEHTCPGEIYFYRRIDRDHTIILRDDKGIIDVLWDTNVHVSSCYWFSISMFLERLLQRISLFVTSAATRFALESSAQFALLSCSSRDFLLTNLNSKGDIILLRMAAT